jgi:hypothetical protein
MSPRLKYALLGLVVLFVANIGWRIWSNWGLITIEVQDAPVAEVVRKLEKQGGVRLRTNLPAETKITMRVRNVSLMHAMEILSSVSGAGWSVAYFTAPTKGEIENALGTFATSDEVTGWKRFSVPMPRGMGGMEEGTPDPRDDEWKVEKPAAGNLHAYLEQGSQWVSAQFWAPEQWNPNVSSAPKAGTVSKVVPKLAKAAGGQSAEVFLLRARPQRDMAGGPPPDGERRGGRGGPPSDDMRRIMEARMLAQIEKLPADKRGEAKAEFDERKKFFEEMSQLTPEQRREKMQERMESEMNNTERAQRFESAMTQRGAMQTASQRNERNQRYLDRKRQATE